jgi:hypothetical protein
LGFAATAELINRARENAARQIVAIFEFEKGRRDRVLFIFGGKAIFLGRTFALLPPHGKLFWGFSLTLRN